MFRIIISDADGNSEAIGDPQFFEEVQLTPVASELFPETIDAPDLGMQEETSSDISQKRVVQ